MSSDEEGPVLGTNSARRQRLFSDSEDDDGGGDARGRGSDDEGRRSAEGGRAASQSQPGRDRDTDEEEEEERKKAEQKKKDDAKKKKPKGPVRRQMISEDMLTGKNGVSKIPELFSTFQFGGKGREKEDLSRILAKLEHWIHLLHPKQPFDQCLQRIEFLGLKRKVVKVHLKKMRMGMLSNFEDERVLNDDDDDLDENTNANPPEEMEHLPPNPSQSERHVIDDEFPDDDELMDIMDQDAQNRRPGPGPEVAQTQNRGQTSSGGGSGGVNVSQLASSQKKGPSQSEFDEFMDVDFDDDNPFGPEDENDDNLFDKQIEEQLRKAEEAERRQQQNTTAVAEATTILMSGVTADSSTNIQTSPSPQPQEQTADLESESGATRKSQECQDSESGHFDNDKYEETEAIAGSPAPTPVTEEGAEAEESGAREDRDDAEEGLVDAAKEGAELDTAPDPDTEKENEVAPEPEADEGEERAKVAAKVNPEDIGIDLDDLADASDSD